MFFVVTLYKISWTNILTIERNAVFYGNIETAHGSVCYDTLYKSGVMQIK